MMKLYTNEKMVLLLFLLLLVPVLAMWNLNNQYLLTQELWYYGYDYQGHYIALKQDVDYAWWQGSLIIIALWLVVTCFVLLVVHYMEQDKQKRVTS